MTQGNHDTQIGPNVWLVPGPESQDASAPVAIEQYDPATRSPQEVLQLAHEVLDAQAVAGYEGDEGAKAFLSKVAGKISTEDIYSGGFTIPGTDEWIPSNKTTTYSYEYSDESGHVHQHAVDKTLGERLVAFQQQLIEEAQTDKVGELVMPTSTGNVELFAPAPDKPEAQPSQSGERAATNSSENGRYISFDQKVYKNGAKHVYGVDVEGKKHHLSHDEMLESYGHAGDYQGKALGKKLVNGRINNGQALLESDRAELNKLIHDGEDAWLTQDIDVSAEDGKNEEEHFADIEEIFTQEPANDRSGEGIRARARRLMGRASTFIKTLPASGYLKYLNAKTIALDRKVKLAEGDKEGWTRNRKIMAGMIAGTIGVGALVIAARHGHNILGVFNGDEHEHAHGANGNHPHGGNNHHTGGHNGQHNGGHKGHGAGHHGAGGHNQPTVESLPKGSTISDQVNEQLKSMNVHYTDHQLYSVVDKVLAHNHLSYADARHLPVGFQTHLLHPEQIKEILEKTKS